MMSEVRFVTTQKGHVIVVLIYRKPLDDDWARARGSRALAIESLRWSSSGEDRGRSKVKKVLVEGAKDEEVEMIEETYTVKGKPYVNYDRGGLLTAQCRRA